MSPAPYAVVVPKGYRIGAWEVREPLASGAFATVYRAVRSTAHGGGLPRRAALKFLPTGTRTPRQLRHLRDLAEREVRLLRRLRSPRLIRMYDTLTVDDPEHPELDGATVLVLEQAEESLDAVLDRSPAPEHAPALLAQICEGLHQLRHAGWVHGDLKPANVLLMADGSVRLADFNTAAELEGTHAYTTAFATPDYTPPELLWPETDERGTRTRPSADVWAFGVLAHVALTGALPLPGGSPQARADAVMRYARGHEELRLSPALPDGWREIVRDCLAPAGADRPTTEVLLRRVEAAAGVPGPPRLSRLRPRGPRHRRPVLRAVLSAAVLGTTVLAAKVHAHVTAEDGTPVYAALPKAQAFPTGPNGKVLYGYHHCPRDSVCFFSEHNGNGNMCVWRGDDSDWQSGRATCDWTADAPVRSVFNNLDDDRPDRAVAYFRGTGFRPADADRRRTAQRTGCTPVNSMGNLAGTYAPRSHKLIDSCSSFTAVVDYLTPW
ncbi:MULTISPECIES: protein kinase domain-containing protein [unclassified Streptomyces]|uniref:protein kinase domain-containing protein n=1 Tax=unclassified Streptomyces TaxID=2593676 RepID=UPI000A47C7E6|nr:MULTISPECIES: protein kinase [unclassified Streptomyces]AZM60457.1 serine/threonine protein kinase [Streptomyces sp. WAC 01438]RSM98572.1 serine/threonine protein kinase [Streptomyces sp. WAC 01420]